MSNRVYLFICLFSLIVGLTGCSAGYTILEKRGTSLIPVPDHKVEGLREIAANGNNQDRLNLIRKRFSTNDDDPVFQNFYGAVLLINGDYQKAAISFNYSLQSLLKDGLLRYSNDPGLNSRLNTPKQKFSITQVSRQENQDILDGLRIYFLEKNRGPLFNSLKNRSGHIPDPPIFKDSGLIGLALESISESLQNTDFHPKVITYKSESLNKDDINRTSINEVSQNLITACILTHDQECLNSAILLISRHPKSKWTPALENHMAISFYLLYDNRFKRHLNYSNRNLFFSQNDYQTSYR